MVVAAVEVVMDIAVGAVVLLAFVAVDLSTVAVLAAAAVVDVLAALS